MMIEFLWPKPRSAKSRGESVSFPQWSGSGGGRFKVAFEAIGSAPDETRSAEISLELIANADHPEGYELILGRDGALVKAGSDVGLFYGLLTLAQWVGLHREAETALTDLWVKDYPDYPVRGVMLDISRTKVPTMETLFELIDWLASMKVNQVQLYMEHTFAYKGHEAVWADASPMTGAEIIELDQFCRDRFIELVPNQNSFGHFHRWLIHDAYRDLAECPDGVTHPFSDEIEPFSLCPSDERALDLLDDLYGQLTPHFSSNLLNVGLDETFDLGMGKSAEACEKEGKGPVYAAFLKSVHRLAKKHGKRMMFWGDIIINHPSLIQELPKDAIALEWGYEADHPFESHGRLFAESGLEFYVCPGTSSWQALGGRSQNAIANLARSAMDGATAGASGYLMTDWGDFGHLQPLPVSYLGFLCGAGFCWNLSSADVDFDPAPYMDRLVFFDKNRVMGGFARDLGNVYLASGEQTTNGTGLFFLMRFIKDTVSLERLGGLDATGLRRAREFLDSLPDPNEAEMKRDDARWITDEFVWVRDISLWLCELGIARFEAGRESRIEELAPDLRVSLGERLSNLIKERAGLWLNRNRSGGLNESQYWLNRVLRALAVDKRNLT